MVFKNLCNTVLWRKVASALEGLKTGQTNMLCLRAPLYPTEQPAQQKQTVFICFALRNQIVDNYRSPYLYLQRLFAFHVFHNTRGHLSKALIEEIKSKHCDERMG